VGESARPDVEPAKATDAPPGGPRAPSRGTCYARSLRFRSAQARSVSRSCTSGAVGLLGRLGTDVDHMDVRPGGAAGRRPGMALPEPDPVTAATLSLNGIRTFSSVGCVD